METAMSVTQFSSDHRVAWPAILAFPISAIAAILASKGSRLSMNFSDRDLSYKRCIIYRHGIGFCHHISKKCAFVVINGSSVA